ncbi:hypothetical protein H4F05_09475 [Vibrio cholerae]
MPRTPHPADMEIIKLLQQQGCIKSEAMQRLKREVYQLQPEEISKVKNYADHFGLRAKEQLIDEILELRRDELLTQLAEA